MKKSTLLIIAIGGVIAIAATGFQPVYSFNTTGASVNAISPAQSDCTEQIKKAGQNDDKPRKGRKKLRQKRKSRKVWW